MSSLFVESVGLFAPGLVGWENSRSILAGDTAYSSEPLPKYKPQLLPANERRRSSAVVRLAFGSCEDAVRGRVDEAEHLASVFASSGGDYVINDQICRAVLEEEKAVSPTQFHNSVHNAAAGYWSIAAKSQHSSISLSACDYSVASGFTETQALVAVEKIPVLLVCCDTFVIEPMSLKRPVKHPFSAALWLTPEPSEKTMARLDVSLGAGSGCEQCVLNSDLDFLFKDNPAARLLPVLELLAAGTAGAVDFTMAGEQVLTVTVSPC